MEWIPYTPSPDPDWYDLYRKRAWSNSRFHCEGCGRFVARVNSKTKSYYNGNTTVYYIDYECSRCGPSTTYLT